MVEICTISDEVFVLTTIQAYGEKWIEMYIEKQCHEPKNMLALLPDKKRLKKRVRWTNQREMKRSRKT
jgi:hypothetical protein